MSVLLFVVTMICYLDIFTSDEVKFEILCNPLYKMLDSMMDKTYDENYLV